MNDLRDEDRGEQQIPYATDPFVVQERGEVVQLRNIVLWISKQPWPQDDSQTWDGLVAAYDKAMSPEPVAPLPNNGFRVGK